MQIVYKAGGDWKDEDGNSYHAKPVNKLSDAGEGYYATLKEALASKSSKKPVKKEPKQFDAIKGDE